MIEIFAGAFIMLLGIIIGFALAVSIANAKQVGDD